MVSQRVEIPAWSGCIGSGNSSTVIQVVVKNSHTLLGLNRRTGGSPQRTGSKPGKARHRKRRWASCLIKSG